MELWLQGGKPVQQIAGELGISTQSLKPWKKRLAAAPRGVPPGAAAGHAKKNSGYHCRAIRERFERVKAMSHEYSVNLLCLTLGVSASGYHAWTRRVPSHRAQANAALWPLIHQAHQASRQTYGSPRITHWLHDHGQPCGRVRVAKLMRQAGINRRPRRRFRPLSLTDSDHNLPVAPNRLLAQAQPTRPDAVWVADITYVETQEGFLYVAGILDRCRRRCIGWAMGDTLGHHAAAGRADRKSVV